MAEDNKPLKYIRYAFGEIVLVVIGILIALQINDWNSKNQLLAQEILVLQDFHESLIQDKKILELHLAENGLAKKSAKILLDYIETGAPYKDSLKYHFGNTTIIWPTYLNKSEFESLKSNDFNLISNKKLRNNIIWLYGSDTMEDNYNIYRDFIFSASENILNTRFESFWSGNYENWITKNNYFTGYDPSTVQSVSIPVDYDKLKTDQEYIYFLRSLINKYNWKLEGSGFSTQEAIIDILQSIEAELKILKEK